jgi:hypothetical protein
MIRNATLREEIEWAAESALADYKAVVVSHRGNLGFLASGRYDSREIAHRQATRIHNQDDVNTYVVTRGRGDSLVVWLSREMTL